MRKTIVSTIIVSLTIITACGRTETDIGRSDQSDTTATAVQVEKSICGEGNTQDKAFCFIKKEMYKEAGDLLANSKGENKVESVLRTYISCMNGSAMTDDCLKVSDSVFYLHDKKVIDNGEMILLINTLADKRILDARREADKAVEEYNSKYFAPEIGMTEEKVLESTWGKPQKINKTTNRYGVSEQWVYGSGRYVYLDDGVVTSIQE